MKSLLRNANWRMTCPKCRSTNVDLEEDQRAFLGGGRHQVQLHCYTCGKVIYGEQAIQQEADRQFAEWEKGQKENEGRPQPAPARTSVYDSRRPGPSAAEARRRQEAEQARREEQRRRQEEEVTRVKQEEERKRREVMALAEAEEARRREEARAAEEARNQAEDLRRREEARSAEDGRRQAEPGDEGLDGGADNGGDIDQLEEGQQTEPVFFNAAGEQMCAWPGCGKIARPNSKYCSRNCSNKNARARHSKRKDKDDVELV
jgi:hypothetical protein